MNITANVDVMNFDNINNNFGYGVTRLFDLKKCAIAVALRRLPGVWSNNEVKKIK
jgi:hypothetical protein